MGDERLRKKDPVKPKRRIRHPGKPPGALNRKTLQRRTLDRQAIEAGISPLDYMLKILRAPDPTRLNDESVVEFVERYAASVDLKLQAARFAAPYVHARIATEVRVKTDHANDKPVDVLELARSVAFLLTMAERKQRTVDVAPVTRQLN